MAFKTKCQTPNIVLDPSTINGQTMRVTITLPGDLPRTFPMEGPPRVRLEHELATVMAMAISPLLTNTQMTATIGIATPSDRVCAVDMMLPSGCAFPMDGDPRKPVMEARELLMNNIHNAIELALMPMFVGYTPTAQQAQQAQQAQPGEVTEDGQPVMSGLRPAARATA